MIFGSWNKETSGLFNTHSTEDEVKIQHIFLTESRYFLCQPLHGKTYFTKDFVKNAFTSDLRTIKLHFSTPGDPENYMESVNDKLIFSQGIWQLLEEKITDLGIQLEANDVVRVGRQILKISKIFVYSEGSTANSRVQSSIYTAYNQQNAVNSHFQGTNDIGNNILQTQNNSINRGNEIMDSARSINNNSRSSNIMMCRICLEPESKFNPFENALCACSARMPAHVNCLISWLNRKCESTKYKNMTYFDMSQLFCDICHTKYPSSISVNGEVRSIVNVQAPDKKSYVTIDVYELTRDVIKGILLMEFLTKDTTKITLGRYEGSDIVFKDISISRNHALITWKNNKLYINDEKSKFGTLKKIQGRLSFNDCVNKRFVVDKFIFCFHVMNSKKLCQCFKRKMSFVTNPVDKDSNLYEEDMPEPTIVVNPPIVSPILNGTVHLESLQPANYAEIRNERQSQNNQPNQNLSNFARENNIPRTPNVAGANLLYSSMNQNNVRSPSQDRISRTNNVQYLSNIVNNRQSQRNETLNQNQRANISLVIPEPNENNAFSQRIQTEANYPDDDIILKEMQEDSLNRKSRNSPDIYGYRDSNKFGQPDPQRFASSRRILEILNADQELINEELIIKEHDLDEWRSEEMSMLDQFNLSQPINVL